MEVPVLKAVLASLDGINAEIAKEYVRGEDGRFYLQAEGMVLKEKVEGKIEEANRKKAELGAEIERLKGELAKAPNAEEYARFKQTIEDLENGKGGEKFKKALDRELEAHRKQFEAQAQEARAQLEQEKVARANAEGSLRSYKIRQEVSAAVLGAGARKTGIKHLLPLVESQFEITPEGKVIPVKRSPDGKSYAPILGTDFEPMPLAEYASKHLRSSEEWAIFFESGSGGGANGNAGNGGGSAGGFRISRADAQDATKYQAARAAAEKAGQHLTIDPE